MEERFAAILLMAGEGRRLGSPIPKQFLTLGSNKIYLLTLETFVKSNVFEQIILVCHPAWMEEVKKEIPHDDRITLVEGGNTRQASSNQGLLACDPGTSYVVIHDAVRPFISPAILERNITAVLQHQAVDTCIPSADTLVYAPEKTSITSIPPRKHFFRGQTPQTFDYHLITKAHRHTTQSDATDDCALILELGHPVAIVEGEDENIKITTELDVELANLIYSKLNLESEQRI